MFLDVELLSKETLHRPFSGDELDALLRTFRKDLPERRRCAWDAFYSSSEDALTQAAHSMRIILASIIAELGSNERVQACAWFDHSKKPTISDRVRLLMYGPEDHVPAPIRHGDAANGALCFPLCAFQSQGISDADNGQGYQH